MSWADTARKVEDLGFSSLVMPDHFGDQLSPVPALAVAASATSTLRVGALVFGNDYRHPVMLAKEMATLDVLSEGRMEFGLGAGWMQTDYDESGMTYDRPGVRIERMVESLDVIEGLFGAEPFSYDGEHYNISEMNGLPKPVQSRPPLLIGGGGKRMLGVAARRADIVGITANLRAGVVGPDAAADSMSDAYDQKVAWVKDAAGDRFDDIELSSLTMAFVATDDRAGSLEFVASMFDSTPELAGESPAVLVGSVGEMVEQLQTRRERWGFSYPVLQGDDIDEMAAIIAELAGS